MNGQIDFLEVLFSDYSLVDFEKSQIISSFELVIENKSIRKINHYLYRHLCSNCLFNDYGNLEGFVRHYSAPTGYQDFIRYFTLIGPHIIKGKNEDLNSLNRYLLRRAYRELKQIG